MTSKRLAAWFLLWAGAAAAAHAEVRPYVWTLPADVQDTDTVQLDYSVTNLKADTDNIVETSWVHELEFRAGLAEGWEFSVFQSFLQTRDASGGAFGYQGWKLGTRIQLAGADRWPVGVGLYADYLRSENWLEPAAGTLTLILARPVLDVSLHYNQTWHMELQADGTSEESYQAAAGVDLTPWLHGALESTGSHDRGRYALGVTGSLHRGDRYGFTWGAVWGLNARTPDVASRMLMSLGW